MKYIPQSLLRVIGLIVLVGSTAGISWAQKATISDEPLSERLVEYKIEATLIPEEKKIAGKQRLTWKNPDSKPVGELQFHLYLNAFRNEQSTFMKESGGEHRGFEAEGENPWGGVDIERMQIVNPAQQDAAPIGRQTEGVDLTEEITFIHPDDGNLEDMTVVSVMLPDPVGPGETITLDIEFESRLPEIFARTGWEQKEDGSVFFMAAQWFPKLGVYEVPGQRYVPADAPSGKWSTHQFHANSEFYANFGTYDVSITTPSDFKVGASGVQVDEVEEDGFRTVSYRAEDVHDFAWTASEQFIEYNEKWKHVDLKLLIQPEHEGQKDRHFDSAIASLELFEKWVGPYPYTTLTLVDGVGGSNGMEYPTLITCGTYYGLPKWLRALELVTIHEFGHQYFYGMLASNEAEEAWLDEGMNSYLEMRIMDEVYGEGAVLDLPWIKISDGEMQRMGYIFSNPESGPLFMKSWEHKNSDYGKASYSKPATVMKTLENHLGWDVMKEVMQTYYKEWSFRHPTTRDFIEVANRVSGQDLGWFFDQYVYDTAVVDYGVKDIEVADLNEGTVTSKVTVERLQDGFFPQEIKVIFENGIEEVVEWDGRASEEEFTFERPVAVAEVRIDPDKKVWLDISDINNRRRVEPDSGFAWLQVSNLVVGIQMFFGFVSGLF